jgi:hypothetical protein
VGRLGEKIGMGILREMSYQYLRDVRSYPYGLVSLHDGTFQAELAGIEKYLTARGLLKIRETEI